MHENLHWLPVQSRISCKLSVTVSSLTHLSLTRFSLYTPISGGFVILQKYILCIPHVTQRTKTSHTQHRQSALTLTSLVVPPQPEAMEFSPVSVTSSSLPIFKTAPQKKQQQKTNKQKTKQKTTTTKQQQQQHLYKH